MEPITIVKSKVAPLDRADVDTLAPRRERQDAGEREREQGLLLRRSHRWHRWIGTGPPFA